MISLVCFLSRPHGFNVLENMINSEKYEILKVYTHSLKPKSEDPNQSVREDYENFVQICKSHKIRLETIDSKNSYPNVPTCDFIIEVSWRYLIPIEVTEKAKIAAFGIHRGKLPNYAGARPIKQALENNENEIILSAHKLDPQIDTGKTIATLSHPVNYEKNQSFEENENRLRNEITPFFSKLVFETLELLTSKKN